MLTVAGLSPSLDLTYLVDDLRLGEIHRPTQVVRCAGGKPLNLARSAARLGSDVLVVAILGGPTGRTVADALTAERVGLVEVPTPAETRTCVSIATAATGELTEVYEYAAPVPGEVLARFQVALTAAMSSRPGWLAISGGPPQRHDPDLVGELVALAHRAGLRAAVDTHGPALTAALDRSPDLVKVNRAEAAEGLGMPLDSDLAELARALQARSGGAVVITDGSAGALAAVPGSAGPGIVRLGPPTRRGRFPVGSGDAFLGGLLAALDGGQSWLEALRTAAAAGTANALVPGPGILDPALVGDLRLELDATPGDPEARAD